jgi:hypothetical protein
MDIKTKEDTKIAKMYFVDICFVDFLEYGWLKLYLCWLLLIFIASDESNIKTELELS